MPKLPTLTGGSVSRVMTDTFSGYNHNIRIADGECYDDTNLTGDHYPILATRKRRKTVMNLSAPGGLIEKDALGYVDNGTLYYNGHETAVNDLTVGEKTLVGMGAYILILPDRKYYNTADGTDYGLIDAVYDKTDPAITVTYEPCDVDGNVYTVSTTKPDEPENGAYWWDDDTKTLMQWTTVQQGWSEVVAVFTKVSFPTNGILPQLFRQGDGVEISGLDDELSGTKYIYMLGGSGAESDYLVLGGLVGPAGSETKSVLIKRQMPDMDFIVECQNRLWGCKYGIVDGKTVNELYCSALGDFRNWRQYQGLSTDSWAASVGSDGIWTGACNYLGHPVFFKENRIHMITVSATGGHRVDETICRGVQAGSHKSLAVVGETLYYKSRTDVCAWQGGFPTGVSTALGDGYYKSAVAGVFGSKYYISMQTGSCWHLFVFDTQKGIWFREDDLRVDHFARVDDELYCIDHGHKLLALNGTVYGTEEATLPWSWETGLLYFQYPDKKWLSRYDVRLNMSEQATAKLYIMYDSSGTWVDSGTIKRNGTGTVVVPVRPRRCDHLRVKLEGTGDVKIFSVARILEVGSDV